MKTEMAKRIVNGACALSAWYVAYLILSIALTLCGLAQPGKMGATVIWTTLYASPIALILALTSLLILRRHKDIFTRHRLRAVVLIGGAGMSAYCAFILWAIHTMGNFAL
jgi:hypothetical protein